MDTLPDLPLDEMIGARRLAEIVSVDRRTVQRWCSTGELPSKTIGKTFVVVWSDFVEYWNNKQSSK